MALIGYLSTDSFAGSWSEALLKALAAWLHFPASWHGLQLANLILRKTAHFLEFFVLGILLYRAIAPLVRTTLVPVPGWVILAGGIYAMTAELFQAFTVTRGPSLVDASLNLTGVLSSQWLIGRAELRARSVCPASEP